VTAKNKVDVRIGGKDYSLVGVESEEYIQKVALYIDKKMGAIMRHNSKLSTSMAAVLTAINVADDYFKAHDAEGSLNKELKQALAEIEALKQENRRLAEENTSLGNKNTNLQLELAKREAELGEVRKATNKPIR